MPEVNANPIRQLQQPDYTPIPDGYVDRTHVTIPPVSTRKSLENFPEEVYRLDPETHLVRFMSALLGDSGVGQLRKRLLLARLAGGLDGTFFEDLDGFYGAIFGLRRTQSERLYAYDPQNSVLTPDDWAEVTLRDASYRTRVSQFMAGISHGPTAIGMELIAEAILGVNCDVYEGFEYTDRALLRRTWGQVEAIGTYGSLEAFTWGQLEYIEVA